MKTRSGLRSAASLKWLIPGMGVKRWLLLLAFGVAVLGLGAVYFLIVLYRAGILPRQVYQLLTLQFLPPLVRVALPVVLGLVAIALAVNRLGVSVLQPFLHTGGVPLADAVLRHRQRGRGPAIVAIGGGNGLSTLLRGLKRHTSNITAIVTVADDGGSSGRIRRELGLPPPGDFRNCIAALADDESLITQLFQYRFGLTADGPAGANGELSGHSFGNLLIAALTGISGSFEKGLEQSSQVLAIQGRILPSTLADVTLVGDVREQRNSRENGSAAAGEAQLQRVVGESRIPRTEGVIERVFLRPEHAPAYPAAVRAILTADLVVLGPGSLFTSVMPNLLVSGIRQALESTSAAVVYVCNVANQPGETDGFDTDRYLEALERHIGPGLIDLMVVNQVEPSERKGTGQQFVPLGKRTEIPLVIQDLIDPEYPWRHNSDKLARLILSLV